MKRILIVIMASILAFAAVQLLKSDDNTSPTTVADAQATASDDSPECLAEDVSLTIEDADRTAIENALVTQLHDVPAGTQTTINIATFDSSQATGSELYSDGYGSYNFEATKNTDGTWQVNSFISCKS